MPVREIRVGNRGNADRMGGVGDVEQESVPFARATGPSNRGIYRDIVALRWAGSIRTRRCRGDYSIDHRLQSGTEGSAVGGSRRPGPTPCLDDAVQRRRNKARRNYRLVALERRPKSAVGLRLRNLTAGLGDILLRLTVAGRR